MKDYMFSLCDSPRAGMGPHMKEGVKYVACYSY